MNPRQAIDPDTGEPPLVPEQNIRDIESMAYKTDNERMAELLGKYEGVDDVCAWCGKAKETHGKPGVWLDADGTNTRHQGLCGTLGVSSQFYSRKRDGVHIPDYQHDANTRGEMLAAVEKAGKRFTLLAYFGPYTRWEWATIDQPTLFKACLAVMESTDAE